MKPIFAHIALALSLAMAPIPSAIALNTDLPDLGNSAGNVMTPAREKELGQAFMRNVRKNQAVMDDPLLSDYIQKLGNRLVKNSSNLGQSFEFFIIDNPQINAFAGPGGYIGIFSGLILTTQTESELAAVIAHEIAHVTQQHLLRAWESASDMAIPNAAILLAAIALGVAIGGDAGIAAAAGGQAALIQRQINFTRANEKEADRLGIEILADAKFEPRAMPAFFSRMGKATRTYSTKIPEFLLTHPVSTNRTSDSLGRAEQYPYIQQKEDLQYHLTREYLKQQQIDNPITSVKEYDRLIKDGRYRNRLATEYGRALALRRMNRFKEAADALDKLLRQEPQVLEFIVTRAQIDMQMKHTQTALQRLQDALQDNPSSYALNITYAEAALGHGKHQAALSQLQQYIEYRPNDPRIYELMSRAAGENRKTIQGYEYLAKMHHLDGNIEAAILQLEIALKEPNISFFESSKIESRLKKLNEEKKAQKKQKEGNKIKFKAS